MSLMFAFNSAQGAEHLHTITKRVAKDGSSRHTNTRLGEVAQGLMREDYFHEQNSSPKGTKRPAQENRPANKKPRTLGRGFGL